MRILRRGYSYTDGIDPATGELDAGLFFICFQRDPHAQFAALQRRLGASDALNEYIRHTSSALFAIPAGVPPGRVWRLCATGAEPLVAMSFDVSADAYDRFMGRYSATLSPQLADLAGVARRAAGARRRLWTRRADGRLVARLGADPVAAIDPSAPFVEAVRGRHPGVDVRRAAAEELPFGDGDVRWRRSPSSSSTSCATRWRAARRWRGSTRPGGVVAACVWDLAGGRAPISPFWRAALRTRPERPRRDGLAGGRAGHLEALLAEAGCRGRARRRAPLSSSIRRSTIGGSHSPSASGRPAPTSSASTRSAGRRAGALPRGGRRRPVLAARGGLGGVRRQPVALTTRR